MQLLRRFRSKDIHSIFDKDSDKMMEHIFNVIFVISVLGISFYVGKWLLDHNPFD